VLLHNIGIFVISTSSLIANKLQCWNRSGFDLDHEARLFKSLS